MRYAPSYEPKMMIVRCH